MKNENEKPDLDLISNGEAAIEENTEEFIAPELGKIKDEKEETDSSVVVEDTPVTNDAVETQEVIEQSNNLAFYSCKACGSKFVMSSYSSIGLCSFCGFGQIVKEKDIDLSNIYLLPFTSSLNSAKKDYKKKIIFNPAVPIVFKKKKIIKKMKKLYIPCMVYDIDVNGNISFLAADSIKNVPSVPKQVYECGFSTNFNFENIVNCSCSQISDEMFSSISKYNCESIKEFDSSSLTDSYLVFADEDKNLNLDKIKERINKYCTSLARESVSHQLKKVNKNELNFNVKNIKEVYVPIYYLSVKYKGRYYTFIKNGQNGSSVIDTAFEKKNLIVFGLIVFIISFVILLLLSFLF